MSPISLRSNLQAAIAMAALSAATAAVVPQAHADTWNGNTDAGFGGTVGNGTLTFTDNGTTVSGTFTQGASTTFDNVLVIFIDSVSGGFSDTSVFTDSGDGLRRAISGFDGGVNRSTLTFDSGFSPDYAIALGPVSDNWGGIWELVGSGSHTYLDTVNLSGLGDGAAGTYTFSFDLANIGVTAGDSFELFGTYISNSGYRSTEAIAGDDNGTQGWSPFTQTAFVTYTTTPVPEPTAFALVLLGSSVLWLRRRR